MGPDLIIFDCDGVIADSEIISATVLIAQLAELGLPVTLDEVRRDFLGRSFPTVARLLRDRFGQPLPGDFEASYRRRLLDRFATELRPTPGLTEMLAGLTHPACVATSSSPPRVATTLAVLGLTARFGPHVFTASEVANGKPAPDLFLLAARRMGIAPARCLVVEDSPPGIAAGLAAGMQVLHYRGGAHLRGLPATPGPVRGFDNWAEFPQFLSETPQGAAAP
ncbi:HAD family hydrolase [Paracoccus spongiarum]|uniref:HAD family hydrolase n=1 Tax=Paracoccus spongiarum TaxID=3064387 RepID=A0ABT9JEG2_9RHOB|nr:HAD family hydrolase [Paracoccus sp. 2205BS29-5]MDP5308144.1 HAD family hydrolase [Paracoccus sp. 2205BS29-5]